MNAILNTTILSAALAASVWVALRLIPRRSLNAATRYLVWWTVLAITIALPAVSYRLARPPQSGQVPLAFVTIPIAPESIPVVAPVLPAMDPRPARIMVPSPDWRTSLLAAWLLASAFLLGRLAISYILLDRRRARAWAPPAHLQTRVESWLALCGTSRRVHLAASTEIAIPIAVGPHRPSILFPATMLHDLADEDLNRIGLHEAAHLARRDDYALILQRILEALFALHPVVRWVARQIDLEREIACDDFVIAALGRARSYADCLTRIVEICGCVRPSLAAAPMADDLSHLSRRVEMLLDRTRHTGTRLLKLRLAGIVAALACLAWLAGRSPGLVAFAMPLAHAIVPVVYAPAMAVQVESQPQTVAAPQSGETTRDLQGLVIEDSSGHALPSAELRVHRAGQRELAADLETDREGRFSAAGLPPGDYTIDVSKPNFVNTTFRLRLPAGALHLRLVRFGVIEGQAADTTGKPLPGRILSPGGSTAGSARIAVLVKPAGSEELRSFRETTLDDDGRYRVSDLPPGQYAIGLWYAGLKNGSGVQLYPDNRRPRFFSVGGGEEYRDVNFTVSQSTGFQISGKVQLPKPGTKFALALGIPEQPTMPIAQTATDPQGNFRFENIAPGVYDLFAAGPQTGYGAFDIILGPEPLYGRTRVQMGAQNVEGLDIPLTTGSSLSIILKPHGSGPPPDGCPAGATVLVSSLEPWGVMFNGRVSATFGKEQTIRNLAPGRFRLAAQGLGAGCYQVNQPVADLRSAADAPTAVELAAAGSIRGTARNVTAGAAIILRHAEATEGAQTRLAYPDPEGRFLFDALPPGRYRVASQVPTAPSIEVDVRGGSPTTVEVP